MAKDKHEPKDAKSKFQISDDAEKTLIGLMLIVIALIGLLNRGIVGEFLTYVFVYAFGAFYFLFFFFLMFFGIYLIVKKKGLSLKINLNFLGTFLLFISALIAASMQGDSLSVRSVFSVYHSQIGSISAGVFHIESLANVGLTGGGFIGFFLTALLNTAVSTIGTKIIVVLFILSGLFLLLRKPVGVLNVKLKALLTARKTRRAEARKAVSVVADPDSTAAIKAAPAVAVPESPTVPEAKAEPYGSPFSIKRAVKPAPTAFTPPLTPEKKDSYLIDAREVGEDETAAELEGKPSDPFLNLLRKPTAPAEPEPTEENDDEEDVRGPTLERSARPSVSPLEKSYGFREQPKTNEFVVDPRPRPSAAPSLPRRYLLPPLDLLSEHKDSGKYEQNVAVARRRTEEINAVFNDFRIKASVISYTIGPSVTRYNVRTEPGVRVSALANLVSEIQVALRGDKSVRIETVVQGKDTSGIEVGNPAPMMVPFKKCFAAVQDERESLIVPLGQGIDGDVIQMSLDDLPHLLVAGATGSGKSVFIHSLILSLIMRNYPEDLKLIMIDPKKVEFTKYHDLPHLYCPIISEPDMATAALYKLTSEMERRYTILSRYETTNLSEYRRLCAARPDLEALPSIVVIVDEFADLISNNAKEIEPLIQRLAQKARAAGIYLIIATQRPSVNVITGDIKANIPARVALSVSSAIDSRTILDEVGAETLLGKGDLLARIPGRKFLIRVQSPFVDNSEISNVVRYLKEQAKPVFNPDFLNLELREEEDGSLAPLSKENRKKGMEDEYYEEIKSYVIQSQTASSSSIMRHYGLGYSRAASILDALEEEGIIKTVGNGRRAVLKKPDDII